MPSVEALFVSPGRRSAMTRRDRVRAVAGRGFEGCAHAKPPKREVLFVSAQHLRDVGVDPGTIKENVTVDGADVEQWPVGQRVRAGEAVFEVTMVCDPCRLMEEIRPGLQAELEGRRGMLTRVVESGDVALGDEIELL